MRETAPDPLDADPAAGLGLMGDEAAVPVGEIRERGGFGTP
jgi:hypothetical protein